MSVAGDGDRQGRMPHERVLGAGDRLRREEFAETADLP